MAGGRQPAWGRGQDSSGRPAPVVPGGGRGAVQKRNAGLPPSQEHNPYPSIREKSATRFTASRKRIRRLSRRSRLAASGSLTVTWSKKSSIGLRREASAAIAAVKSSASTAAAAVDSAASS